MSDCTHEHIVTWRYADGDDAGQVAGMWSCADCSHKFVPIQQLLDAESKLAAALKDAEKFEIALNDEISWRRAEEAKASELASRLDTLQRAVSILAQSVAACEGVSLAYYMRSTKEAPEAINLIASLEPCPHPKEPCPHPNWLPFKAEDREYCAMCGEERERVVETQRKNSDGV